MLKFFTDLAAGLDALRRHATLFFLAVAIVALALLGRSWLDARDATAKLQATLAAQQKTITDADQRQSTRDAQLTQTLAQITAAKQKVQTPTQAAAALTQAIPQLISTGPSGQPLPSPITIDLPPASGTKNSSASTSRNSSTAKTSSTANTTSTSAAVASADAPEPSPTNASATSATAWSALKSELAKLGIDRAKQPAGAAPGTQSAQAAANSAATSQSASVTQTDSAQQGSGATEKGIASAQSATNANANAPATSSAQTNSPPAIIRIPQNDLKPLYDAVEDCEICQAKLAAAQGDLADEKTKFTAATAQKDAAIAAARGTFWTRARRAAKYLIIGAAAGAVLARYH
jgi:hypothetical protein